MSDKEETKRIPQVLMQVTKQGGFGNTAIVGSVTMRTAATLVITVVLGAFLWQTPLFKNNWLAIIAYIAFANICMGQTPTGRNILTNIYGIVFKKPANMVVREDMTTTTIGHGIKEIDDGYPELDAIPFRMTGTKNFALVYSITSSINRWSTEEDKIRQARGVKSLFNILEGGESLVIVEKQDNDTGMLKLRESLLNKEKFEGDDLQAMSNRRSTLLYNAGTSEHGRSIQQYAILLVKPKNVVRTTNELRKISRLTRPATNPADVLFATMGFEGGCEWFQHTAKEHFRDEDGRIIGEQVTPVEDNNESEITFDRRRRKKRTPQPGKDTRTPNMKTVKRNPQQQKQVNGRRNRSQESRRNPVDKETKKKKSEVKGGTRSGG